MPYFQLVEILDLLGTFVFAISGIRLAAYQDMDWFGAYVIGLVTAIGGGTVRDVLLGLTPFWMLDATYLTVTGIALLTVILFKDKILSFGKAIFLFDAIGLGLFTVTGISKSLTLDMPIYTCILMGTMTGAVGGVIRDIIINEVPLLFRKDIYALTCIVGGIVYFIGYAFSEFIPFYEILAVAVVIITRLIAVKYKLELPKLRNK
ncbi:MAG: trimeric intracellular cation channel family protein [Candidatus Kapaibacteriales bacterium]